MWGIEESISEDMVTDVSFVSRHNEYPSSFSFQSEFEKLVEIWRPEVLARAD